MSEQDNSTRVAKLEASFEFIKDLLKEIRDEIKGMPVKEDYEKLDRRLTVLEKAQTALAIKVGVSAGILGVLGTLAMKLLLG